MDYINFTGTQVNYYMVCHRKLWLFTHDITMERENENVQIGKLVGQETYKREQKEIALDDRVVLDWMELQDNPDGTKTVHEVKKGRSVEAAHRMQMLYYLYYLQSKGIEAVGQLDYPLLKKSERLELTPQATSELRAALKDIERILESPEVPPRLTTKRFCEKCAYFELCWS